MFLFYHFKRLKCLVGVVGMVGAIHLSGDLHSCK